MMIRYSGRMERSEGMASGYGLFSVCEEMVCPGQGCVVRTGVVLEEMPAGIVGHVTGKPELAVHGILCANRMVDCRYGEEIVLLLYNAGKAPFRVGKGTLIGELVFSLCIHPKLVQVKQGMEAIS